MENREQKRDQPPAIAPKARARHTQPKDGKKWANISTRNKLAEQRKAGREGKWQTSHDLRTGAPCPSLSLCLATLSSPVPSLPQLLLSFHIKANAITLAAYEGPLHILNKASIACMLSTHGRRLWRKVRVAHILIQCKFCRRNCHVCVCGFFFLIFFRFQAMAKPVLTYFDFGGRAEGIRLAFHVGGIGMCV